MPRNDNTGDDTAEIAMQTLRRAFPERRCNMSDLYESACAHCRGDRLDEDIDAA